MVIQERHPVQELNVIHTLDQIVAEAIRETRPHWVIEIGNRSPVSTLYHGYLLSLLGEESHTLLSITPNLKEMPRRKNIHYLEEGIGSDLSEQVRRLISPGERVMAVLGAGCGDRNPLKGIQRYAPLVTEGSYLILAGEVANFAVKNVAFEPDWTARHLQLYLRNGTSPRPPRSPLLRRNAGPPSPAELRR